MCRIDTNYDDTMTEQAFLDGYNPHDFPVVLVTVDTVLLTWHEEQLKVLLVQRASHPELGKWGLPGGFVNQAQDHSLEASARRSVAAKTNVEPPYLEQVCTLGSPERDPRGWSTAVVYSALMPHCASTPFVESVANTQWQPVNQLAQLEIAFDHRQGIETAIERYKQKALYSFVPVFALPELFTITDLRKVHEALIGTAIQRKSFIRRAEASQMFIDSGDVRSERGRPAVLYKAKPAIGGYRFVRNIEL